jgi:TonB family protein
MKHWGWLRDRLRRFIRGGTVPDARVLLSSFIAHGLALVLITWLVVSQRSGPVIIFPNRQELAKGNPRAVYLPPSANRPRLTVAQKTSTRRVKKAVPAEPESAGDNLTGERLRQRARLETQSLIQSFKFRTIYGFSPFSYQLAYQISGQMPTISADQLPPRFEQYVTVEVTIDAQGRVADARVVAGVVDQTIAQTLLSAIREFKYRPATREGIPVPSQCDIVIHIPT